MTKTRKLDPAEVRRKILLVDDHAVLREGVAAQVNGEADLIVCAEAANAREAMSLVERLDPDLVLADITLPGRNGLELIRDLKSVRPELPVLVLSMHEPDVFAEKVLRAGGRGYVSKQQSGRELISAIRKVLAGQIYVSPEVSTRLLDGLSGSAQRAPASPIETLTNRELEVFTLIGRAQETKEIARRLGMSPRTVEVHRTNIRHKLRLKTGPELARHAVLWVEAVG
jgi:DNA-binding NarL/FixJ family response regulator